nr:hypothetical protein [Tanacetum cinerariifolium]
MMVMIVNNSSRLSMSRNRVTIRTIMYIITKHHPPPPPGSDSELEDVIVPTSRSTLLLLPPIRRFLDLNALHYKVKSLTQQMKDRAKTEFLTMNRLANVDRGMKEFKYDLTGLDSALRDEIQRHNQMEQMVTKLGKQVQELKEDDVRKENKRLKMMLGSSEDCIRPCDAIAVSVAYVVVDDLDIPTATDDPAAHEETLPSEP